MATFSAAPQFVCYLIHKIKPVVETKKREGSSVLGRSSESPSHSFIAVSARWKCITRCDWGFLHCGRWMKARRILVDSAFHTFLTCMTELSNRQSFWQSFSPTVITHYDLFLSLHQEGLSMSGQGSSNPGRNERKVIDRCLEIIDRHIAILDRCIAKLQKVIESRKD